MKVNKIYIPIFFFAAIAAGFLLGVILVKAPKSNQELLANSNKLKLNRLIDFIENDYVDQINTDSIVDQTVNGILEKLDPHSVYISKNDLAEVTQSMKGDFVGIGVNFFMQNDTVTVIKPVENGPSEKAGILAGDRILLANNEKLYGENMTTEKLYSKLKGEIDSEVNLLIYRKSENKKIKIKIIRNTIPVKSVDIAIMLNKKDGYIKINRFSETTSKEFKNGLNKLIKKGAKSLIIDVRDNGGGYLDQAVIIADEFLSEDKLIVFTKNNKGRIDKTFATDTGTFETGKVTILINEASASASEILAGAIQDNDRGLVVGRRSFGKGLVQREMPLGDGSSVRLTVARYYTPTGRSIQKSYKNGTQEYYNDFTNRYQNGELYAKDSIKIADTLQFKTPKGSILYGGGGIVPDVFVPIEATKGNEVIPMLMQSGLVSNFVFTVLDTNRSDFKKLTFQQIVNKIATTEKYFNNFVAFIDTKATFVDLRSNKNYVKRFLTAEFCRQLLGENQFYQVVLKEDNMIKKAL